MNDTNCTYAKYVSDEEIDVVLPTHGRDSRGRLVTGDLRSRPDVLALLDYYPVTESAMPSEQVSGHHYEKRYSPPNSNDTIVQYWVLVEDIPEEEPVKVYSKLKILMAADQAGFAEDLMDMIESNRKLKYIWDASNTIEDNDILKSYTPTIASALSKTEQEVYAFLDNCLAD